MMRVLTVVLAVLALAPLRAWAATVDSFFMTASTPPSGPSCTDLRNSLPRSESLLPSVAKVYFFYLLRDLRAGDVVSTQYYRPDGSFYGSAGGTQPIYTQSAVLGCWWDTVEVAGTELAGTPGMWRAALLVNKSEQASLDFTVQEDEGGKDGLLVPARNGISALVFFESDRKAGDPPQYEILSKELLASSIRFSRDEKGNVKEVFVGEPGSVQRFNGSKVTAIQLKVVQVPPTVIKSKRP
jgi:hypothetical protein